MQQQWHALLLTCSAVPAAPAVQFLDGMNGDSVTEVAQQLASLFGTAFS